MRRLSLFIPVAAMLMLFSATTAHATTFTFDTDPFAGTNVLNTLGRQIVGGELFITFNPATDVFAFDPTVFGINELHFANDVAANLPTTDVNTVVLESFDNDNNPGTPFNAGTAADLIADRITTPGAGFFIYFNQGLDLPRLVFSTDLSSNTADLKVLARMLNLTGQAGRDAMPSFTAENFAAVPEPTSLLLLGTGLLGLARAGIRRARARA